MTRFTSVPLNLSPLQFIGWIFEFTRHFHLAKSTTSNAHLILIQEVMEIIALIRPALYLIVAFFGNGLSRTAGNAGFTAAVNIKKAV